MAKFAADFVVVAIAIAVIFAVSLPGSEGRPSSDSDLSNMVEALRVLEQYDKMYSQLARPRFGRSLMPAGAESRIPLEEMLNLVVDVDGGNNLNK